MAKIVIELASGAGNQVGITMDGIIERLEQPMVVNYALLLKRILTNVIEGVTKTGIVEPMKVSEIWADIVREAEAKSKKIIVPGDEGFMAPRDISKVNES